ncbi:hypothetical protein F0U61_47910 [Archangium violaceum]|uniref:MopE-related protein n=1 Tax=Archangium violaceum TaxID=83451 RepID=UPI002B317CF3|nr:hypothetical protein F0U61_47910 [Archangium violaceum]
MKRFYLWLMGLLLLCFGCTVPDLRDFEEREPRACDTLHPCTDGYRCLEGVCILASCEQPRAYYLDKDKDGYGENVESFVACASPNDSYVTRTGDCDESRAEVHPGAQELCNNRDDNCKNGTDEDFKVGLVCDRPDGCQGAWTCNAQGTESTCEAREGQWHPDEDKDGRGSNKVPGISACKQPAGYAANDFDCDDSNAQRYAGAPELCNGVDDNCDSVQDEGLGLGDSCDLGSGCTGIKACAADGSIKCSDVTPSLTYYPDEDRDSYGQTDAGVLTCTPGAGYISRAGDCNDGNPFTYTDARELCDGEDNNCNGSVDEDGACFSGSGTWANYSSFGSADNWRSVAVWDDGGVWVTGGTNLLQVRQPGQKFFVSPTGTCVGVWNAVWVDPRNGTAFLGGDAAAVGSHGPETSSCDFNGAYATYTDVRGIIGVPLSDGGFDIHFVGIAKEFPYNGRAFRLIDFSTPLDAKEVDNQLWDTHGISREVLFAVGGTEVPGINARIYRFNPAQNTWVDENVQNIPGIGDNIFRGVWVVNSQLAYAVGGGGSVLMWNGTSWSLHSKPSTENLLSVLAFGKNAVYVSTDNGKVYRYNGSSWSAVLTSSLGALNDLAGTSPEDIWVVGDKGKRFHWPQ